MARQIKGLPSGVERVYIPDVLDNGADEEPVRIVIVNPTEAQKRNFLVNQTTSIRIGDDGKPLLDEEGNPIAKVDLASSNRWKRDAILSCVVRVENYTRAGEAGPVPILTADDLWTHGEDAIVWDVGSEILSGFSLLDGQKKTSAKPSDSTPATTPASTGTVDSADQPETAYPGDATTHDRQTTFSTSPN